MTKIIPMIPGQSMWDLWWTKWHWDRCFPEYILRFSPDNFIPPLHHYSEKRKKPIIIFITVLHNKPQGWGASVASAAGSFTKKNPLSTHLLLGPRLRMSGAIPLFLLHDFTTWTRITITLPLSVWINCDRTRKNNVPNILAPVPWYLQPVEFNPGK
jgi:hypothetical protein